MIAMSTRQDGEGSDAIGAVAEYKLQTPVGGGEGHVRREVQVPSQYHMGGHGSEAYQISPVPVREKVGGHHLGVSSTGRRSHATLRVYREDSFWQDASTCKTFSRDFADAACPRSFATCQRAG